MDQRNELAVLGDRRGAKLSLDQGLARDDVSSGVVPLDHGATVQR